MKLSTSLVAAKKITSTVPRSNFSDKELEQAAHLILKAEGVINPIVLRRTSIESYEVVDGHFEYYAAARAREIDALKGEMIGAFIVDDGNEEIIKEQVKLLRKPKPISLSNRGSDSGNLEIRITNLESRIETLVEEFKKEQSNNRQVLAEELKALKEQIPNQIKPLDAFNNLNSRELISRLKSAGFSEKKAAQIAEVVDEERTKKKFESLPDVVERVKIPSGKKQQRGISEKKMVEIVDSWSKLLFI